MEDAIEESPNFTGFVLAIAIPGAPPRLVNVSEKEWRKHRALMPCESSASQPAVITRFAVFD